ncbi:hypothetical protein A2765_04005 [Candidatus Kaiserbacteria bacterium RIFCSPHIGHO2_01_FULL_56_24]|uniref:Uncharacterized protein n=1 Tax=Candidatus Kaiserbacteria bacterium RIFCSPHIGHO2_01_FULL_56_24 TaxID=1798487 RepID=A0A1F6DE73_9BACT|nr:MAG: hypothetical protein A2765_04005 [Candidatus Kaiserbacteria bacterium RIFCSPHIGHO2_01_FULL_56_24]
MTRRGKRQIRKTQLPFITKQLELRGIYHRQDASDIYDASQGVVEHFRSGDVHSLFLHNVLSYRQDTLPLILRKEKTAWLK